MLTVLDIFLFNEQFRFIRYSNTKSVHTFNPNQSLEHNVSGILVFVLFPNISYFLIGILLVFAT